MKWMETILFCVYKNAPVCVCFRKINALNVVARKQFFFCGIFFFPDIWYWVRKTANKKIYNLKYFIQEYICTKNIFHSCSVFDRLSHKLYAVACLFFRSSIEMYLHIYIWTTVCTCTCANCRYFCVCRALCLHLVYHVQIRMIMRVLLSEKKSKLNKKTFIRIIHI